MDIVKNAKEVGTEIEQGIESGLKKGKEILENVASHLPFANLAKKDHSTFVVEVDLPGVKKEDIEISVDGNKLNVSALRHANKKVSVMTIICRKVFMGRSHAPLSYLMILTKMK